MKKKTNNLLKKTLLITLLFIGIVSFLGYRYLRNGLHPKDESNDELVEVTVPLGSNRNQIGEILEEKDLINSSLIFKIYTKVKQENNFQAGSYQISQSMSLEEITGYLKDGGTPIPQDALGRLTIAEGIPIEEIADRIERQTDLTSERFMKIIQDSTYVKDMIAKYPELLADAEEASDNTRYTLEGYLFPATYDIFEETTVESLIDEMLMQTNQVMTSYYDEIENSPLNVHEILTLASYIEREGTADKDRELISGVFYNRMELGMPLQTDPSVSYALGIHRERVSHADLEVDSPYNTYMYTGIGAGPINSPSESAIKASVYPAETEYLYFLADLKTGNVYFAETYDEHLEYKSEYLDKD